MWLKPIHTYHMFLGVRSLHTAYRVLYPGPHKSAIMVSARLHSFLELGVFFQTHWHLATSSSWGPYLRAGCHLSATLSSQRPSALPCHVAFSTGLSQHVSSLLQGYQENLALPSAKPYSIIYPQEGHLITFPQSYLLLVESHNFHPLLKGEGL